MSYATARFIGLHERKGALLPGRDADIVVWDPEATFKVTPSLMHHRHSITPYLEKILRGPVEMTFLRGEKIFDRGAFSSRPLGKPLFSTLGES
jgi:allantoinase